MAKTGGSPGNRTADVNSGRRKDGSSPALPDVPVENQVVAEIRVDNKNIIRHTDHAD